MPWNLRQRDAAEAPLECHSFDGCGKKNGLRPLLARITKLRRNYFCGTRLGPEQMDNGLCVSSLRGKSLAVCGRPAELAIRTRPLDFRQRRTDPTGLVSTTPKVNGAIFDFWVEMFAADTKRQ